MQSSGSHATSPNIPSSSFSYNAFSSSFGSSSILGSEHYSRGATPKRRKIDRACDACRTRKCRCDGPKKADNICTNCLQSKKPCTYVEASKPRGPPKSYVTGLEDKLEKMEALLRRLRPGQDFSSDLGPTFIRDSWKAPEPQSSSREVSTSKSQSRPVPPSSKHPPIFNFTPLRTSSHLIINPDTYSNSKHKRPPADDDSETSDENRDSSDPDELVDNFEQGMQRLTLRGQGRNVVSYARFHGQSSSIRLVDATRKLRRAHLMAHQDGASNSSSSTIDTSPSPEIANSLRRPEYWRAPQWELAYEGIHEDSTKLLSSVLQKFPESDLAEVLIALYFQHVNPQFSLLHRRMFYKQWKSRLHERDIWFSALTMCVFSVASRWSNDRRVLPQDTDRQRPNDLDWSKAGWDFFQVVIDIHRARRSLLCPATLFEVQTFSLLALYLRGANEDSAGWTFVTVGIRKAQDVGAHRKTVYKRNPTPDEELWKRAFWLLIVLDRTGSATLGRQCALGEEDFDLELPVEVDDEYWDVEDPVAAFKQPANQPSKVTAFNLWIRITQIIAFTLRTLYALDTTRIFLGHIPLPSSEVIVKQLDDALTTWHESIPEHLRWSNDIEDPVFANQSTTLFSTYQLTQILIHRPFIPFSKIPPFRMTSKRGPSRSNDHTLPNSALTICVKAAQKCARMIKGQLQRGFANVTLLITVCHICAPILIIHLWDLKAKEILERSMNTSLSEDVKPQHALDIEKAKEDIAIFFNALEWAEPRYASARPMLNDLRNSLPNMQADYPDNRESSPQPEELRYPHRHGQWDSPKEPFIASTQPSSLGRNWDEPAPGHTVRNNSHPVAAERAPFYDPYRRDSDPVVEQQFPPFWSSQQASHSLPQVPNSRNSSIASSMNERGSLPYISTVRRTSSFNYPLPSPVRYASPSPTRSEHSQHGVYGGSYHYSAPLNGGGGGGYTMGDDSMHHHLPTSDARSLPTPADYDKRYSRASEWEDNRSVYPRHDQPSWS